MEKVLVLNADYTPINVTSVYKGFTLVNKGKAEILKASDKPILSGMGEFVERFYRYSNQPTIQGGTEDMLIATIIAAANGRFFGIVQPESSPSSQQLTSYS